MTATGSFICAATLFLGFATWVTPCSSGSPSQSPGNLADLGWMSGSWLARGEKEQVEEHWMAPQGDCMLGMNRTVTQSGKTSFEHLRIGKAGDKIIYYASPGGRPATEFPLVKSEARKVVFENAQHAFPQRIIYWLDDEGSLHGRIEGTIQGKERSHEWRWEKMK